MGDSRASLPKRERLAKREDFLALYSRGEKLHARHCVLYFAPNNRQYSRIGVTASRKLGRLVARNRVKRRYKELFRLNKHSLSPSTDLVINARRSATSADFELLRRDFLKALKRWSKKRQGP